MECLFAQLLVVFVVGRAESTKDVDVLVGQLEGSCFKAHGAGRVGQHEAKVNVDDVALAVNEDVAVMTVLELQDV